MENKEVKSLKRQRSILIVIVAALTFVTLISMTYAYVQQGIAQENAALTGYNAKEAIRQSRLAQEALEEANRQMEIATLQAKEQKKPAKKRISERQLFNP